MGEPCEERRRERSPADALDDMSGGALLELLRSVVATLDGAIERRRAGEAEPVEDSGSSGTAPVDTAPTKGAPVPRPDGSGSG